MTNFGNNRKSLIPREFLDDCSALFGKRQDRMGILGKNEGIPAVLKAESSSLSQQVASRSSTKVSLGVSG